MRAGVRFGPYKVVKELGRGAMGVVYEAEDDRTGKHVALKVLPPAKATGNRAARFERELEIMQRLDHPSILQVLGGGSEQGVSYYAMELLPGPTLADRVREKDATRDELLAHLVDVAFALGAAHREGIVHRDVKPENVLLGPDRRARLADFGLARDLDAEERLTKTNASVGTPRYMSPEQVLAEPVDARSDVFALGVLLYEILTGKPPFKRDTLAELVASVKERPVPPTQRRPGLDARFDAICARALARSPGDRYPDGEGFGRALEDVIARSWTKAAAPRKPLVLAALAALALCGGAIAANLLTAPSSSPDVVRVETKTPATPPADPRAKARAARELGLAREKAGDPASAVELLGEAERGGVADASSLAALARAEAELGLTDLALGHAERALALEPRSAEAHLAAARALERGGEPSRALPHYESALATTPDDGSVLLATGTLLVELGKKDRAESLLRRARERLPKDARPATQLGVLAFERGDFAKAEDLFRAALALDARDREARNGLAAALLESQRHDEAARLLEKLLDDEPALALAWHNLALARRKLGRVDDAQVAIAKARALEPRNADHAKEAGRIARERLDLAGAVAAFAEAVALDPGDVEASVDLAAVLARVDRREEARELLRRVAATHRDDARVRRALEALERP